jgi:hypothetical protein
MHRAVGAAHWESTCLACGRPWIQSLALQKKLQKITKKLKNKTHVQSELGMQLSDRAHT